ncbi:unnamed protein product [Thelazia callipaeda]|uniref:Cytochrome c oxidase assembly protein COX11, mitochondrial n=1 Tax=Thelazia callipaeda TaxID=103827 RepID=A0A0N5CUA6_THECL|nr:unnamed protein product [Thelazia callipaeda]
MLTLIRTSGCTIWCHQLLQTYRKVPPVIVCRTLGNCTKGFKHSKNTMYYWASVGVAFFSFAMLSVPAFRIFCEKTAVTGLTKIADDFERISSMKKVKNRLIRVSFNADLDSALKWQFKPLQKEIYVYPGETALVFYSARNETDKPMIGISSYNLSPFQAAYYFNKIQCFCFEDQILNPGEQVDLPVFFYIDPDYVNDPDLEYTDNVVLSYKFFESKSDLVLPDPFDPENRPTIVRNASSAVKGENDLEGIRSESVEVNKSNTVKIMDS